MRHLQRLWLIDDDENEHLLVRHALKMEGNSVPLESFTRPDKAIEKLESLEGGFPDLIICDFNLGLVNGLDFLKRLRASTAAAIPVIIRSSSGSQEDVNAAYAHGANCYLLKGLDLDAIQNNFKLLLRFWSSMCLPEVDKSRSERTASRERKDEPLSMSETR